MPWVSGCATSPPAASGITAPSPVPEGMVRIRGGRFAMGTETGMPYEGPVHEVEVKEFLIDAKEVTNADFEKFVAATGYRTEAEKWGWAGVFNQRTGEWEPVKGADWRHPDGPHDSISARMTAPVVQVSWNDAVAYAKWAGKRLPSEAEWEFAARGGLVGKPYAWGDELTPGKKFQANYWQGDWPAGNTAADGYRGVAPVGSFPPNGYGLFDMTGNAWEWTADWFAPYGEGQPPANGTEKVIRGGSFLCSEHFCTGYRVAARNKNTPDSATNNMGFRCAR